MKDREKNVVFQISKLDHNSIHHYRFKIQIQESNLSVFVYGCVQFWLHSYVKFLNIMSTSLRSLFSSVLDNLTTTPGNCGFIGYKQWTQTS